MTAQETNIVNGVSTTLASTMAAGATSFVVTSAADFPSVPFYVVIDPDTPANREYMLVDSAVVGTTCSMTSISKRDLAGSAGAVEHLADVVVRVTPPMAQLFEDIYDWVDANYIAKTLFDANTVLYATSDDTPVALTVSASRIVGRKATGDIAALTPAEAKTILALDTAWSKTVAVQGEVKVPSGAVDYLVPFTVHVESGEVLTITKVFDAIRAGTSVTYKITKNGSDEITGISATTTHNATDVADFTVVDGDRLAVVVTAVDTTPDGLEVTFCGTMSSID